MRSIAVFLIVVLCWACCFAAEPETEAVSTGSKFSAEAYESIETLTSIYQPYLANIGSYKPMYFSYGADPSKTRFQISFKYQLLGERSRLNESLNWMRGLHLGYTQNSHWDLDSDSSPFEDTSYMPEIFYMTGNTSARPGWLDVLLYHAGVLHESNGRDGEESRSTNYLYFSPSAILFDKSSRLGIQVTPKFLAYFHNSDDNPDLKKYRGNFELAVKAGRADSLVLETNFRFAPKGVSTQFDLTYPLGMGFFRNLELYLHAQYAYSLAETLLNYKERVDAFRFGIAIVR